MIFGESVDKMPVCFTHVAILRPPMPPRVIRIWFLALIAIALGGGASAHASIGPAATIDGPAPEILELGGAAMADDGTGGLVYRRVEAGRTHVFAARFDGRSWSPPQRVDLGQPYNSAWPRIAAANGGRLVVTWTQDGGDGLDGLWGATIPRGRTHFLAPTLIDFTIGEDQAVYPSLATNAGGAALIAYRAIRAFSGGGLPAGYVSGEVRLARFDGSRWQRLGVPANRNRSAPQRAPTADNAPQVALDSAGNAVVAWQEPDDDFVDRVWARRIFGTRMGVPLAVSPLREGDQLVRGGADQLALAETDLGRVVVAFRQLPDPRDRSAAPRLYVNQMEDSTSESARRFNGPELVGPAGAAAPSVALGGDEDAVVAYPRGGVAALGYRPRPGPFAARDLGEALDGPPLGLVAGIDGRGVLAAATGGGGGEVAVHELSGTNAVETQSVFAPLGGAVRELAVAGSGAGDALVAFAQGADGDRQIAAAVVDAAPAPFALTLPSWTREARPRFSWDRARDTLGPVTYIVSVDGRRIARTTATRLRLREGTIGQGAHRVTVVARDSAGQTTAARPDSYRLDRQPPLTPMRRKGRLLSVQIADPGGRRASGPAREASNVHWGDGRDTQFVTRRASHRYAKPGRYRVSVVAVDAAGNRSVTRRMVVVR
jgi:hypothetical protein